LWTHCTLSLEQKGSGALTFTGSASALDVTLAGSGVVSLQGNTSKLALTLSGSGVIDAAQLPAPRGSLDLTGSGIVKATLTESATVSARAPAPSSCSVAQSSP
jgi:hypothetical protein